MKLRNLVIALWLLCFGIVAPFIIAYLWNDKAYAILWFALGMTIVVALSFVWLATKVMYYEHKEAIAALDKFMEFQSMQHQKEILGKQVDANEIKIHKADMEKEKAIALARREILVEFIKANRPANTKETKKLWEKVGEELDNYLKELFK